ncbi:peptide chain release factor H [Parapusillimonas sp. SGNA-6]|uniref:peptide chain release factor H n=1 Tax=Parapedobacter sp. SGR-10 TaxID=2710879 RepID=UPI0013D0E994|nr:peptide chain release factor H [Parapedobacter sp. SGR-10]NGF55383.1 peptide chain release factor H [Parapedobacter sp. SGR-10]NGM89147.1 peptide chain release factor H [Parapusillimonas sp. SGNA-6]
MKKMMIQITSGKGPAECCRVVACVQSLMMKQARQQGFQMEVLENKVGELNGTLLSSTMMLAGNDLDDFLKEWTGTIQWIAPSPYRRYHKRKNWFIGVAVFDAKILMQWNLRDVKLETCRSSGPGGQNVNKVETAVRGTHLPSGIQVLATDTRSQLENKKLCLARLEARVLVWQAEQLMEQQQNQWQHHNELERGNPVKTIKRDLF